MAKLEIPIKVDLDEIDKLIDELRHLQTYKLYEGADQKLVDLDEVVKIFAGHVKAEGEQPTIEPERKKGKWIKKEKIYPELPEDSDYEFECSLCGWSDAHDDKMIVPYCWHCGAEMSE